MAGRDDLADAERHIAHHRASQLPPVNVALHHHRIAIFPVGRAEDLRRMRLALMHDDDAEARPFADRLDHIGRLHRMLVLNGEAIGHLRFRHRNAGGLGDLLGLLLVHGKRRSEHAGMGIGNSQIFEDALDGAVLAERAMQRIEGDVGLELDQHRSDIARDIDASDPVAFILERIGTRLPRRQRHGPLGRESSQQNGHMLAFHFPSSPITAGLHLSIRAVFALTISATLSPSLPAGCPPDGKRGKRVERLKSGNAFRQRIRELIRWQVLTIPRDSLSVKTAAKTAL
ncbi:hypothetical protein MESS4_710033 [Mesorhizobium sp. STM 4661]|nr:hypothetical protein MESS4_710033 [Mesorhizobium sp. STM 4661]